MIVYMLTAVFAASLPVGYFIAKGLYKMFVAEEQGMTPHQKWCIEHGQAY